MDRLSQSLFSVYLLSSISLAATCRTDSGTKRAINVANGANYREIVDGQFWRNPKILVGEGGISVRFPESELERGELTIDQTLLLLNQQDSRVWPYGAVVTLSEAALGSPPAHHEAISKMLQDLKKALERVGIKAELWPAA